MNEFEQAEERRKRQREEIKQKRIRQLRRRMTISGCILLCIIIALAAFAVNVAKKKKLAADKPEWKQFICPDNFQSTLCQEYDIDGIPRFLFFDKKGRIISLDAPRPSSSKIIEYINQHIK